MDRIYDMIVAAMDFVWSLWLSSCTSSSSPAGDQRGLCGDAFNPSCATDILSPTSPIQSTTPMTTKVEPVVEEGEPLGMSSPLKVLMAQWGDLEDVINTMPTPTQSIDELIAALEAIDFSSMLETPQDSWPHDNEDHCNQGERLSVSSVIDEDDDAPFSVAFTMQGILSSWRDEVVGSDWLHNSKRMFVRGFDWSCKMLCESHLMPFIQCAINLLGALLP
ncbi:hypothetical protein H257_12457 [Aphanomyces astaci]|uniref:Uncharacterized protein n=1 Tax=Aphanomyces astaci TaxID=112090 RepID=W4FZ45_APHAT|nr:hypothetical protein H257_12457 [Aphanomyces astaci]ETV72742.1 hypothetical protein H257_12457 [Aphanomyces astaci]|eukprot:XP_009837970.1 hypothetical protein H257_12457 [Aphanomyces astaci]